MEEDKTMGAEGDEDKGKKEEKQKEEVEEAWVRTAFDTTGLQMGESARQVVENLKTRAAEWAAQEAAKKQKRGYRIRDGSGPGAQRRGRAKN